MSRLAAAIRATVALAVFVALGAFGGCVRDTRPARDEIIFGHPSHLRAGISCVDCHAGAVQEGTADTSLLPPKSSCTDCHTAPAEQQCSYCHTVPEAAGPYRDSDRGVRFEHVAHASPSEGQCVRCHASRIDQRSLQAFEPHMPNHDDCASGCHTEEFRALDCASCHVDLSRYEIQDLTSSVRHPMGFTDRHGNAAKADAAVCTQCHEPTFCNDCHMAAPSAVPLELLDHTRVWRDFVHRGDYLSRHAVEASLERNSCALCHGVSFCDGCHEQSGIGGSVAPGSPHPPGWLDPSSINGHARAARRDLLSCASCHEADAEQTCTPCHRAGGVAGNPHPPGFGDGMDVNEHAICRACHM